MAFPVICATKFYLAVRLFCWELFMLPLLYDGHRLVQPVLPLAGYIGGKRLLSRGLAKRIQRIKHHTYAEPFVGMAIMFKRPKS